ncbi:MAG: glycosyltransferase [Acidobacteria bacterium]|nr:glycosyltransferase [Acidobacteriota bacterium]
MNVPPVSIIILSHNRATELKTVLHHIHSLNYPSEAVDTVVVDNGSTDDTRSFLEGRRDLRAILRKDNIGVSAWNDGFAEGKGEWFLALDDDCYLETDGLRAALQAASAEKADLVSFLVRNPQRPSFVFNRHFNTGLLSFWGCAVLLRRNVLETIGGFDPKIFVWGHEVEFMLRFFDAGFRHLYLPSVTAFHINTPTYSEYRLVTNHRHMGYIAGARFPGISGIRALAALLVPFVDGFGRNPLARLNWKLATAAVGGYNDGRRRNYRPVGRHVAEVYLRHFIEFSLRLRIRPALRIARPDRRRYFPFLLETASLRFDKDKEV